MSANLPLLYSILNPDTISDSPSAKSNGARFVSARFVMNQIRHKGLNISRGQEICELIILLKEGVCIITRRDSRTRVILTSYEIVCAILRKLPKRAYLEFDVHPAANVE